jgi:hypothetical protein
MPITHRFGKRIPLPSTRQIRHELIMWAENDLRKSEARAIAAQAMTGREEIPPPQIKA